jgi:hypothetical protein
VTNFFSWSIRQAGGAITEFSGLFLKITLRRASVQITQRTLKWRYNQVTVHDDFKKTKDF